MFYTIRQSLDVLGKQDDGPVAFVVEIILDALALARLIVNVKDAVFHLDMIAWQADYPLDIVGRIIGR